MLLSNIVCMLPIYHLFWVFSLLIQWYLGCNQTFQSTPYTPCHNHFDCLDLTKATHSSFLESIGRLNLIFGKETPFSIHGVNHAFFKTFLLNLMHDVTLSLIKFFLKNHCNTFDITSLTLCSSHSKNLGKFYNLIYSMELFIFH